MEVKEIRTNGVDYHLHVHRSEDSEVLEELNINVVLKELEINGKITVTGWKGIHLVIITSDSPSMEKIYELCREIRLIETISL